MLFETPSADKLDLVGKPFKKVHTVLDLHLIAIVVRVERAFSVNATFQILRQFFICGVTIGEPSVASA